MFPHARVRGSERGARAQAVDGRAGPVIRIGGNSAEESLWWPPGSGALPAGQKYAITPEDLLSYAAAAAAAAAHSVMHSPIAAAAAAAAAAPTALQCLHGDCVWRAHGPQVRRRRAAVERLPRH